MKPERKIVLFLMILAITIFNITGCARRDEMAESDRALLKTQKENTILDNAFISGYSDNEYRKLYEILKKITSYASYLYDYRANLIIIQPYALDIQICNQMINDANVCKWAILYASDMVNLFAHSIFV